MLQGESACCIVSHGFMAWQDTVRHYAKELARMGYCSYCFDFCGGSVVKKGKRHDAIAITHLRRFIGRDGK